MNEGPALVAGQHHAIFSLWTAAARMLWRAFARIRWRASHVYIQQHTISTQSGISVCQAQAMQIVLWNSDDIPHPLLWCSKGPSKNSMPRHSSNDNQSRCKAAHIPEGSGKTCSVTTSPGSPQYSASNWCSGSGRNGLHLKWCKEEKRVQGSQHAAQTKPGKPDRSIPLF